MSGARLLVAAVVAGAVGCSLIIGDLAEPLTGRWRTVEASPAGRALDLVLVEHDGGELTGSGTVRLPDTTYRFAIDSGMATSARVRFRLIVDGTPLGRFDGTVTNRTEIVARTALDAPPDSFGVRLARATDDSTATSRDVGIGPPLAHARVTPPPQDEEDQ